MGKKAKAKAKAAWKRRQKKRMMEAARQAKDHAQQEAALAERKEWAVKANRKIAQGDAWDMICHDKVVE